MIGRALKRNVECDLDVRSARFRDQPLEVVERSQLGKNGLVAALGCADRPRAADVSWRRRQRIVATFAALAANRMDRRQIQDVEAHLGNVWQARFAIAK